MTSGDPLLDLERKNVILRLTDGEEIRGRLVSVRGDMLTVAVEVPRRRRVTRISGGCWRLASFKRRARARSPQADKPGALAIGNETRGRRGIIILSYRCPICPIDVLLSELAIGNETRGRRGSVIFSGRMCKISQN